MIYTEQDLEIDYGPDAFDIINESAWVDGTSIISPNTIPVVESSAIGGVVVRFSDVEALSEEYGVDYIDSMLAIAESNNLDPAYMAVAVDESELIVNPELIYELANVVVVPQSENSLAYQFCEACIDAYAESGDEDYMYLIIDESELIDEETTVNYHRDPKTGKWTKETTTRYYEPGEERLNKTVVAGTIAGLAGLGYGAKKLYDNRGKIKEKLLNLKNRLLRKSIHEDFKDMRTGMGIGYKTGKISERIQEKASSIFNKIKEIMSKVKNKTSKWIAEKISALKNILHRYTEKRDRSQSTENKGFLQKIIDWIKACLEKLAMYFNLAVHYEIDRAEGKAKVILRRR